MLGKSPSRLNLLLNYLRGSIGNRDIFEITLKQLRLQDLHLLNLFFVFCQLLYPRTFVKVLYTLKSLQDMAVPTKSSLHLIKSLKLHIFLELDLVKKGTCTFLALK